MAASDVRPDRRVRTGRALLAVGGFAALGAVALAVAATVRGPDGVVFDVDDAVTADPPSTVPPFTDPDALGATDGAPGRSGDSGRERTSDPDAPVVTAPTTPPVTLPPVTLPPVTTSPASALPGERGSAIPPPRTPRVRPVDLEIEAIDLDGPVRAVGLEADGQLEIPDETEIGWYVYGATPGSPGATVLAAHVTWNRTYGPFYRLGELEPGDSIAVGLDDGTRRRYEVVERTMYDKDALPRDRIWRTTGDESLVLITCGGSFNPEIRRYRQNIVVYAAAVG